MAILLFTDRTVFIDGDMKIPKNEQGLNKLLIPTSNVKLLNMLGEGMMYQ